MGRADFRLPDPAQPAGQRRAARAAGQHGGPAFCGRRPAGRERRPGTQRRAA